MALQIRKLPDAIAFGLVSQYNAMAREVATARSSVHAGATATTGGDFTAPTATARTVSAPVATNEATLVALTAELMAFYAAHIADTYAHKTADTTNTVAAAVPTDTAGCITALNELKSDYGAHIGSTTFHYGADATNTIAAADADDLAKAITLANELRTDAVAHVARALTCQTLEVVGP